MALFQRAFETVTSRPRIGYHVMMFAVVAGVVLAGNSSASHVAKASLMAGQGGYGSVLDASAAADVAAVVADKTDLSIASDASVAASTLNAQVALLTASDDSLAKRQVVATAGAAAHTIQNYVVGSGDTLSGIASHFNITSDTIKWANNLGDVDALKPGQALVILPISGIQYVVQAGDTPDTLAAKYQANAAQIVSFNNAEVKGLAVGQNIIIPDGVKAEAPKPAVRAAVAAASSNFAPSLTRYAFSGNGYAYGYCTYYVASRRNVPSNWGNAVSWYYNAQASGFSVGRNPAAGAIAWTPAGYYGHVAYVEAVNGDQVLISEMNYNGNWNRVTRRWISAGSMRYIY